MSFVIKQSGNFQHLENFIARVTDDEIYASLESWGEIGTQALANATPVDTGRTADLWSYTVDRSIGQSSISWTNDNVIEGGTPLVILLTYGHATGNGGFVQGRDFINAALADIFDGIAEGVWKVVVAA